MDNWKYAGEVAELSALFIILPPSIEFFKAVPPSPKVERKLETKKGLGISKNSFWIVSGILVLLILTYFFNTLQEERSRELKKINYKTGS